MGGCSNVPREFAIGPPAAGAGRMGVFPGGCPDQLGAHPCHAMPGAVALVGQRGCVVWPSAPSAAVQVHVVSPGHAYRLDWAAVRQDPSRFAPWLWHTTAAAQSLIAQMAQWSFCAQHHSPLQRLASWLLHGLRSLPKPSCCSVSRACRWACSSGFAHHAVFLTLWMRRPPMTQVTS